MKKAPTPPVSEETEWPYRSIFEAVSDGLIIEDSKTHCIVEANLTAAAMHGYTREQFIGLHMTEYIHPDSRRLFKKSARVPHSGGVSETPAIHLRRDGSTFYVEVRRKSFTYQSRPCVLSVVRDISRQVRAEELLYQQVEIRQDTDYPRTGRVTSCSMSRWKSASVSRPRCWIFPERWLPPWNSNRT